MYKLLAKQAVLRQFFQPLTTVNKNVHVDVRFIVFWSVSQKQPLLNSDKRNIRTVCPNTIYSTWKQSLRVTDVYTNITTIFFIVVPCILITLKFFSLTNAPFY